MNLKLLKLGPNFTRLEVGEISIWFSYETPIAFWQNGTMKARKNVWGPTTGKHLNQACEENTPRLDGNIFMNELNAALSRLGT